MRKLKRKGFQQLLLRDAIKKKRCGTRCLLHDKAPLYISAITTTALKGIDFNKFLSYRKFPIWFQKVAILFAIEICLQMKPISL